MAGSDPRGSHSKEDTHNEEKPERPSEPTPGPSHVKTDELTTSSSTSATKATSPLVVVGGRVADPEEPEQPPGIATEDGVLLEKIVKETGTFASLREFEETKIQLERMGEAMKECAVMTMMDCLIQQQQQQRSAIPSLRPSFTRDAPYNKGLSTSLTPINSSTMIRQWLAPLSGASLLSESIPSVKAKPKRTIELEKQLNNLEKQCRIMERHLREHDRDQKSMRKKIHRLEMKILQDGQKQMIWDMMNKIPTEEDLKMIESFHSFAVERKRTESQIKGLNVKVRALNTAMGKMCDPMENNCNEATRNDDVPLRVSLTQGKILDFTKMTIEEREAFFKKAGVTLYVYDRESPEGEETNAKKIKKSTKVKKVNIVDDAQAQESSKKGKKRKASKSMKPAEQSSELESESGSSEYSIEGENTYSEGCIDLEDNTESNRPSNLDGYRPGRRSS